MDRQMDTDDVASEIAKANIETLEVKTDQYGISFATDSFSPYVLVWGDTPEEPTTDNDEDESFPAPTAAPTATPAPTAPPAATAAPAAAATSAVIPQTGDSMPIGLLVGLLIAAAVAFVVLLVSYKRRKH